MASDSVTVPTSTSSILSFVSAPTHYQWTISPEKGVTRWDGSHFPLGYRLFQRVFVAEPSPDLDAVNVYLVDGLAQILHLGNPKVVQQLIGMQNIFQRNIYVFKYIDVEQQRFRGNCSDSHVSAAAFTTGARSEPHLP
jgi:hypothetical protein